jgi:pyruvate kinase
MIISTIEAKRTVPWTERKMVLDDTYSFANAIGESASLAAAVVGAAKIICLTDMGYTAKVVSHFRPPRAILAVSPSEKALRQLALYWGVWGVPIATFGDNIDEAIRQVTSLLKNAGYLNKDERVIFTAALPFTAHRDSNMLRIEQVP